MAVRWAGASTLAHFRIIVTAVLADRPCYTSLQHVPVLISVDEEPMSSILRVSGTDFDVDCFLEESQYTPCAVYRRGEPRWRSNPTGPKNDRSGINLVASDADFDDVATQIEETIAFLTQNMEELQRLRMYPGVEDIILDFGIRRSDEPIQNIEFPSALLRLAGALDITLDLSIYPARKKRKTERPPNTALVRPESHRLLTGASPPW
jgi:hypothetical protein